MIGRVVALVAGVGLIAACAQAVTPPSVAGAGDGEHAQAMVALARWDAAAGSGVAATGRPFVPAGELTSQIGEWEIAVGDDNKVALMAGAIDAIAELSDDLPDGTVTWDDGATTTFGTVTASDALAAIKAEGGGCSDCTHLLVTDARPSTARIDTSRGPATAPAWEFAVQGTSVIVTRIAVGPEDAPKIVPPPWDANDPPVGISIESATRTHDESRITVGFVGARGPGDEPCGADYTAEAVESATAIVVIVTAHGGNPTGACRLVGALRTATVELAHPLGERAVVEVKEGRPVPVGPVP